MLYLSVAIYEPYATVGSRCDVVHTRHHQSVFGVQMSHPAAFLIVYRQSAFRTDEHDIRALVPVEGRDETIQRHIRHCYTGFASNPVQSSLCCHPHVSFSVDGQRDDKIIRQSVGRTDMVCIANYLGSDNHSPDHEAGDRQYSINHKESVKGLICRAHILPIPCSSGRCLLDPPR